MGSAAGGRVWIDDGYGRIAVMAESVAGMWLISVSCDDGRIVDVYHDTLYRPAVNTLSIAPVDQLHEGDRIHFRIETVRHGSSPADVPIQELDESQVSRNFVTLSVIDEAADTPPPRPSTKTREVPNEDVPPPPPRRRHTAFRDTWAYAGALHTVTRAFTEGWPFARLPSALSAEDVAAVTKHDLFLTAKGCWIATDLVQETLEGRVDRNRHSYNRIRHTVLDVAAEHPMPIDAEPTAKRGWCVGIALFVVELCRMADRLHHLPQPTAEGFR